MQTTNQLPPQRRIRSSKRRILYRGDTSSNTHAKPAFQELLHEDASAAVRSTPHSRNRSSSSSSSSYYADDIDVKIDTSSNATTGIYSNAPYNNSTVVWDRNYTFHEYDANQYPMNYNNSNNDNNQEPLRIVPVLTDEFARFLSPYEREYLMQDILAPAISAWSDALWLVPIAGNNEDDKGDNEEISLSNDGSSNQDKVVSQTLTIDKSQLWDSISCGPGIDSGYPSPLVPDEHFSVGVSDADLVVYVSLSFTGNNNNDDDSEGSESDIGQSIEEALSAANNSGSGSSGGDRYPSDNETTTIPSLSPTNQNYIRGQTSNAEDKSFIDSSTPNLGNELAEQISNEILNTTNSDQSQNSFDSTPSPSFISRGNIQAPQCESRDTIASASYCNTDQYDRPIAGSIHFCINLSEGSKNDFFHPSQKLTNIKATMHELAHVLGFNPQSLAHFRNQDGSPRTPRDENGDVPDIEIECTGRSVANQPTATAVVPLPDPSILRFRTTTNGLRIASVVTENVRMVTRNHFDCQEMDGADLENSIIDSNSTSVEGLCIGSHWDRKVFKDDLMNPVIDPPSDASLLISPLTLAYFMDSGWYSINLDRVAPVSSWGRRKGCTFIDSSAPCIINNEVAPPYSSFFCSRSDTSLSCSSDLTRKASCGITEYVTEAGVTSRDFQHFGVKSYSFDFNINSINEVWDGGNDADLDYCPVFEAHQDSLCSSDKIPNKYIVSEIEEFGSSNSRCISNGMCTPIACVMSDHSLRVKVDGEWKTCDHEGQRLQAWWDASDFIICPDPWLICPTFFCPRNCLGTIGGICNTTSGDCMCEMESWEYGKNSSYAPCFDEGVLSKRAFANGQASIREESATLSIYVTNSTILTDDINKSIPRRVHKFFKDLSASEWIGFLCFIAVFIIATGLLVRRMWRKKILTALVLDKSEIISSIVENINFDERRANNSKAVKEALGRNNLLQPVSGMADGIDTNSSTVRKSDEWSGIMSIPSCSEENDIERMN